MGSQISNLLDECIPTSLFFKRSLSNSVAVTTHSSLISVHNHHQEAKKYEVFISFRGVDVRQTFLSHLFAALKGKQIHVFVDDDLETGEDITESLFQIIENSNLSLVIFSKNYPRSRWCLEELEKIYVSMKQRKQIVVPVFYDVDPSCVQQLKGNYAVQVKKWREALLETSNLSGFDSKNSLNDAKLIDAIVSDISKKLRGISGNSNNTGLFGIDSRIEDVEELLGMDLVDDVRMVGIWGMGGIGKTTIASKVYDRNRKNFDGHCFVSNVRETLNIKCGPKDLRDKIIGELLGDKGINLDSSCSLDDCIRRRLKCVKVLLVLDDVHTCMQLKSLFEDCGLYPDSSFGRGSRIIVTSRDRQVLDNVNIINCEIYQVKQLKDNEALQLISWYAFGQNEFQKEYKRFSKEVIEYAHGVPLALIVLGSQLKHRTIRFWEDAFKKLKTTAPLEIQSILRISFDTLDRDEKNILLDIACFLKGLCRDHVERILEASGFHANIGVNCLIDKSLVTEEAGRIRMHDLIEQMGKDIIAEENQSQNRQSRFWTFDDLREAIANNIGTENVEAISIPYCSDQIDMTPKFFILMRKLRFLRIQFKIHCPNGIDFLPHSIRYLDWRYYPLRYLPSNYNLDNLVELHLFGSQLKQLILNKHLRNLKRMNLSCSFDLIRISDLAMAPNLEVVDLRHCTSLVEIGSCLGNLNKLTRLDLHGCTNLCHLPETPHSITELNLRETGIRQLSSRIWHLDDPWKIIPFQSSERLEFDLRLSGLRQLPSTIWHLARLKKVSFRSCVRLENRTNSIFHVTSLVELDLRVSGLRQLPLTISHLADLKQVLFRSSEILELDLREGGIRQLSSTIQHLTHLKQVWLDLGLLRGSSAICL
ncbi:disease resistance protein (TIR-NBS-LRR class) putative [Euphorbia peplus]|nr:disease resistance protein (TIR-NBS-LRR class) putative [Euphorbia peplus]